MRTVVVGHILIKLAEQEFKQRWRLGIYTLAYFSRFLGCI